MRHTFGPFFAFVNLQVPVSTCEYLQVLTDTCNSAGALATREYSTREYELLVGTSLHECEFPFGN
jgi:hypothetical protein